MGFHTEYERWSGFGVMISVNSDLGKFASLLHILVNLRAGLWDKHEKKPTARPKTV